MSEFGGQETVVEGVDDRVEARKTVTPCNGCHVMMAGPRLCAKAIQDTLPAKGGQQEALVGNDIKSQKNYKIWTTAAAACNIIVSDGGRPPVHQVIDGEYEKV